MWLWIQLNMVKGVIAIILFLKLRVTVVRTNHSNMDQPQRQKLLCKFQKIFTKELLRADDIEGRHLLKTSFFFSFATLRRHVYPCWDVSHIPCDRKLWLVFVGLGRGGCCIKFSVLHVSYDWWAAHHLTHVLFWEGSPKCSFSNLVIRAPSPCDSSYDERTHRKWSQGSEWTLSEVTSTEPSAELQVNCSRLPNSP